ncbi:MAG: NAD(P)H-hydrate dehydratase [Candidatus Parvarchaeota archaeon]|nr:NAD(P)H-hydrate dehydratase [Candidatus Parvarchaeota archaeon]
MSYTILNNTCLRGIYKKRENWSHKGDFGKILVIGGSEEYTGSPALVALSALRTGADTAKIFTTKRAADICASFSPEIITIPSSGRYLSYEDIDRIRENISWSNVIALGNGLGTGDGQKELVNALLKESRKKFVIDADGLKILNKELLDNNMLLTPNTHEFEVLFGSKPSNNIEERVSLVKEKARQYGTTILLKGHVDIISNGEHSFINKTNSVYMTKAGTGDVLAGICAGIIGQGNRLLESGCAGAFINGYTGRYVSKSKRESISPIDIIDNMYLTITKWRYQ